jgi:hypothetical protein
MRTPLTMRNVDIRHDEMANARSGCTVSRWLVSGTMHRQLRLSSTDGLGFTFCALIGS